MIEVVYNGQPIKLENTCSLAEILAKLADQTMPFAVAVNGKIIERNRYPLLLINQADEIEVVTPMQGG